MSARVFFYVQHLWGVGHVYRATRVARGMLKAGLDVHLIWGGTQLPGFDFSGLNVHFLKPVRTSDVSFNTLLHANGDVFTDADKADRRDELLSLFDKIAPQVMMTEAFPFGRRQMRFELEPLLKRASRANPKPLLVSSIRDIMQEGRKPSRVEESNALINDFFDLVLVHGDENLIPISATLQGAQAFSSKIRYTGLVVPELEQAFEKVRETNVLVSVGGGAFGKKLVHAALKANELCKAFPDNWLLATGTEMPEAEYLKIKETAPRSVTVVRHITNLVTHLSTARVSVSHAGYNTVGDLLQAKCRAVLFPYTDGQETEQLRRAELMQELGLAICLKPEAFSAAALAKAIDRAIQMPPVKHAIAVDGARRSGEIVSTALKALN